MTKQKNNLRIVNSDELTITPDEPKIVRSDFIQLTIDGKKHTVDAVFNLKDIPEENRGFIVQIICQLRGYNMVNPLVSSSDIDEEEIRQRVDEKYNNSFWSNIKSIFGGI